MYFLDLFTVQRPDKKYSMYSSVYEKQAYVSLIIFYIRY